MPNYVTNKLTFIGDQKLIGKVLEAIRYDGQEIGTFDFNKVIPTPESLMMASGSIEKNAIAIYLTAVNPVTEDYGVKKMSRTDFDKLREGLNELKISGEYGNVSKSIIKEMNEYEDAIKHGGIINLGKKYVDNYIEHGFTSWYDYNVMVKGSKWNSLDPQPMEGNTVVFNTAWSCVLPVVSKLAEIYPKLSFYYQWADEDIGTNVGEAEFENGEKVFEKFLSAQSKEAYDMASEIIGCDLAEFGLEFNEKSQNYEFNEDLYNSMISGMEPQMS